VADVVGVPGRLPAEFFTAGVTSFAEFLATHSPDSLPSRRTAPPLPMASEVPHGTTIVAACHTTGVAMAGDRRATMGNIIAQRDMEKVFQADEFSVVGIAGTAGTALEVVRLFQVELEQGLAVVPLFAGYDLEADDPARAGRILSYDVTGGRYEEHAFHSVGSGSAFARGALKKLYREDFGETDAVLACIHALYDAADDDSATGGPDLTRRIWPLVLSVTADGVRKLGEEEIAALVHRVVEERMISPGGPIASMG